MIQGTYYKEWSTVLGREMEFKVYGHAGVPVLALPARGGRFYDWENNGMPDAIAQLLNEGKVQLFCADAMDGEGLLNGRSAPAPPRRAAGEVFRLPDRRACSPYSDPEQRQKGHPDLDCRCRLGRLPRRPLPSAPSHPVCRCCWHGRHLRPDPFLGHRQR